MITCRECGKQISDKAPVCIHCGYPIQTEQTVSTSKSNSSSNNSLFVISPVTGS